MKRGNPKTSLDANESMKEAKSVHYQMILDALSRLKIGATYEEAAKEAGLTPDQACRRLSELVQAGKVYNVGITRPTSSGRQAMVRQLSSFKEVKQLQLL